MASSGRSNRSGSRRRKSAQPSLSSLKKIGSIWSGRSSWTAIATMVFGLVGSYFGCTPPNTQNSGTPNFPGSWQSPRPTEIGNPTAANPSGVGSSSTSPHPATTGSERESIIVGSFNIQTFGKTKMQRPEVVEILVDIARRFDILAIQELRDGQDGTITEFVRLLNAQGGRFQASVSPKIHYGTGVHSEQLVFIYDTDQVEMIDTPYVATDAGRVMFRPPYVAHFRYRSRYPTEAFSFILMNVHTSPQQTTAEFTALESIINNVLRNHPYEDDFILLGDMNEEPGKFLPYRWFSNQYAAILSHWKTNTAQSKNYDNIIFDHRRTAEFTGEAGVLNLRSQYQLTRERADRVSDHMPVWALFSSKEVVPGAFTQQPAVIR